MKTKQELMGELSDSYRNFSAYEPSETVYSRNQLLSYVWQKIRGSKMNPGCLWKEDADGLWHTECGEIHMFLYGSPTENNYNYCPYCGKVLEENTVKEGKE